MSSAWLHEALLTRDVERVAANPGAAGERVNDARRHLRSARVLASEDPTLAMSACHDAIRKAMTAHMAAKGLRPRAGEGAHRIVLNYARHELGAAISSDDLEAADDIRRDRGLAEYGDFAARQLTTRQITNAADVAERIVKAIASALANTPR